MKASLQPKPMYYSRDYYYSSRFNQQYEKPTPNAITIAEALLKIVVYQFGPPKTLIIDEDRNSFSRCLNAYL